MAAKFVLSHTQAAERIIANYPQQHVQRDMQEMLTEAIANSNILVVDVPQPKATPRYQEKFPHE